MLFRLTKAGGLGFKKSDKKSIREKMEESIQEEIKKTFNPEFVNRLDEIVIFNPLDRKEIIQIVDIQMDEIIPRLQEREIGVSLTPGAKALLAEKGYDPTYGARQLKRTIQKMVEDPLSEEILQGKFHEGSEIRISKKGDGLNFVDVNSDGDSAKQPVADEEVVDQDNA